MYLCVCVCMCVKIPKFLINIGHRIQSRITCAHLRVCACEHVRACVSVYIFLSVSVCTCVCMCLQIPKFFSNIGFSHEALALTYVRAPAHSQVIYRNIWMSHVTHIQMIHVTYMNESCHIYEWVMSHIWESHVTYMNESCHTHSIDPCHTYERVMSHIWMSHVNLMNESCHTYEWVMSHTIHIPLTSRI